MANSLDVTNKAISEYLSQLDKFEIELSEQEQKDLDELNRLLQNHTQQENLSTEIWGTIKQAALDSVEQIIGLDDRGDWRPEQGAVITTPLNFRKGVVATENDKKRFEMWQDRVNSTEESVTEFRNRVIKPDFDRPGTGVRDTFKKSIRRSDGSYENAYNGKPLFEQNDPRTYDQPDSSGDMVRDTRKSINVNHQNAVGRLYKDDKVALYSSANKDGFENDIKTIANNHNNLAASDEHGNKVIRDKDAVEQAENNSDLGWDTERVKQCQKKADKAKNLQLLKNAWQEKGKDLAIGVGKSTLAATGKMLVSESIKIVISETYLEFTQESTDQSLMERAKRLLQKIMERSKKELANLWHKVSQFAASNALSEIVNLIINYFFSTVKNVFKLIRCMIGSIIKAFKIIFDSSRPWEERLFEALKIVSAGIAMATGTMLNELIANAIAVNIPFLAGFAGDIAAVISGLISSILSALVLMLFDRYKATLQIKDENRQIQLLNMQLVGSSVGHAQISAARASAIVAQTTELVRQELISIVEYNSEIEAYTTKISESINRQHETHDEIDEIQQDIEKTQTALNQTRINSNKAIENILNNLPAIDND